MKTRKYLIVDKYGLVLAWDNGEKQLVYCKSNRYPGRHRHAAVAYTKSQVVRLLKANRISRTIRGLATTDSFYMMEVKI